MPFISVIIPCYNRYSLLSSLIESIPAELDIEVVVIDDHSSEDLATIPLEQFKNYQFIKNKQHHRYAGSARNAGIECCTGEYVFFADSDDLIVKNGFLACLEILKKHKPDILFAKSDSFRDHDGGLGNRHLRYNWLVDRIVNGAPTEILARFVTPCAKFIRRDFIEKNKIRFETQKFSNDIVFAASLIANQPGIRVTDEVVYSIREGNLSLTKEIAAESTITRLEALVRYNDLLCNNDLKYLMAPALPLLIRLFRKSVLLTLVWSFKIRFSGHPVLFTTWTIRNIVLRRWFNVVKE